MNYIDELSNKVEAIMNGARNYSLFAVVFVTKVVSPEWEALAKASQKRLEKRVKNG